MTASHHAARPGNGLVIDALSVRDRTGRTLLAPFSLGLGRGQIQIIIGESGAGKSIVCGAVAGTLSPDLSVSGRIVLNGVDLSGLTVAQRRATWSRDLFLLPQEPWNALARSRTVISQITDMPRLHAHAPPPMALGAGRKLLAHLGLSPAIDGPKHPAQLSGGMGQRVALATALGAPAPLILIDEPTKGLDALRRDDAAALLHIVVNEGRSILLVTHDLPLARLMGGNLIVMRDGAVVEAGATADVLASPRHPFTQQLVSCDPATWPGRSYRAGEPIASLEDVSVRAGEQGPELVRKLNLSVRAGDVVGLVGPSGSGKTTIGDTLLKLKRPVEGRILWASEKRRDFQKLYQNPGAAFAPWRTIGTTVSDAVVATGSARRDIKRIAADLMSRVGLSTDLFDRLPHQVSGGELQRIGLVRALLCEPLFLFADEPTSRLDAFMQKQIMTLLAHAVEERALGLLLVSHDATLVSRMASCVVDISSRHPQQEPRSATSRAHDAAPHLKEKAHQ